MLGLHEIVLPTTRTRFDPPDEYRELRETRPVCRLRSGDGRSSWLVSSFDLARSVLGDPRFGVDDTSVLSGNALQPATTEHAPQAGGDMLSSNPPQHTRLRRAHAPYFTVRQSADHRERIEQIVTGRLDRMGRAGPPVDLCVEFATPVPSIIACELLLGAPSSHRGTFERIANVLTDSESAAEDQAAARRELEECARDLVSQGRGVDGDDVLSRVAASGELTDHELIGAAHLLLRASQHDTSRTLALGVLVLLAERSRWEALVEDPSALPGAVEELLRYGTVFHLSHRIALEDVELGGVMIEAGDTVVVSLAAANRDPKKFSDPDRYDSSRDAKGHLAFGSGRHMCLGQHLVRLELEVALAGLMRRFPTLHLAVPLDEIPMYSGEDSVYGVKRLPVSW